MEARGFVAGMLAMALFAVALVALNPGTTADPEKEPPIEAVFAEKIEGGTMVRQVAKNEFEVWTKTDEFNSESVQQELAFIEQELEKSQEECPDNKEYYQCMEQRARDFSSLEFHRMTALERLEKLK